jgi:NTP pyrophosphatase (non-canonical NTP hydrolase)
MNLSEIQGRGRHFRHNYFPAKKNKPDYLFKHLIEEIGEIAADLRDRNFDRSFVSKDGLKHPEGIGSEIADGILLLVALGDELGLRVTEDVTLKLEYHESRLAAKRERKAKK